MQKVQQECILHIVILLDYDWLKDKRKYYKPMISHKMLTKICAETLKNVFSNKEKMASRENFFLV